MIFNPMLVAGLVIVVVSLYFLAKAQRWLFSLTFLIGGILSVASYFYPPDPGFILKPYFLLSLLIAGLLAIIWAVAPEVRTNLYKSINWIITASFLFVLVLVLLDRFPVLTELEIGKERVKIVGRRAEEAIILPILQEKIRVFNLCGVETVRRSLMGESSVRHILQAKLFFVESLLNHGSLNLERKKHLVVEQGETERLIRDYDAYRNAIRDLSRQFSDQIRGVLNKEKQAEVANKLSHSLKVTKGLKKIPPYYDSLALLSCLAGSTKGTFFWLFEGIERFPANPGLQYRLGVAYYGLSRDYMAAIRHTERALMIFTSLKHDLEQYYEQALDLLHKAATGKPRAKDEIKRLEDHKKHVGMEILKQIPEIEAELKNNIAYLLALEGISEGTAKEYSGRALSIDERQPAYLDTRGYVILQFARTRKDVEIALQYFKQATHEAQLRQEQVTDDTVREQFRAVEKLAREHYRIASETLIQVRKEKEMAEERKEKSESYAR